MDSKLQAFNDTDFRVAVKSDSGFNNFLDKVSPPARGVQRVWINELILILRILWELYKLWRGAGFLSKFFLRWRVWGAMRIRSAVSREKRLRELLASAS